MSRSKSRYGELVGRKMAVVFILGLAVFMALLLAAMVGVADVRATDVFLLFLKRVFSLPLKTSALAETVIMELRLPRVFLAFLTGAALAGAGTVMQAVLRNPLADPYILGVSAGASFGTSLAIVSGSALFGPNFVLFQRYSMIGVSFLFSLLTILLVQGLSGLKGARVETLILVGVAVGYIFSAGVSAMKYLSNHDQLREVVLWLMGSLAGARWGNIELIFPLVIIVLSWLWYYAWDLNALSAGEEVATSLGIKTRQLGRRLTILASLLTSAVVAFTGIIGFVGLISPHVCRFLVGSDHRFLLPCSSLMGALLLILADTVARTIISPIELPVGIITAFLGAPFFLYLLFREKRTWWG